MTMGRESPRPRAPRIDLWAAVQNQAEAWARTPSVQTFAAHLPRNGLPGSSAIRDQLQEIEAAAGGLMTHPFQIPRILAIALPLVQGDFERFAEAHGAWVESALAVEAAHRDTIAWLRARLPGYPMLPAPQLAPGTPFTTDEYSGRLVWVPDERSRGLQFVDPAPHISPRLSALGEQQSALEAAARRVAAALSRCEEWVRLAEARSALGPEAKTQLTRTRRNLRQRLSEESVDAYEPDYGLPRNDYRGQVLKEELSLLSGAAFEYGFAFGAANDLIEHAASDIMSQLACYPVTTFTPDDLSVRDPGPPAVVEFTLQDPPLIWPVPAMVAWLSGGVMGDALVVNAVTVNFQANDLSIRLVAETLPGTADAWGGPS